MKRIMITLLFCSLPITALAHSIRPLASALIKIIQNNTCIHSQKVPIYLHTQEKKPASFKWSESVDHTDSQGLWKHTINGEIEPRESNEWVDITILSNFWLWDELGANHTHLVKEEFSFYANLSNNVVRTRQCRGFEPTTIEISLTQEAESSTEVPNNDRSHE